ncbi:MAG: hypothetical protein AAGH65_04655 [Pseudomonadota bacterium]
MSIRNQVLIDAPGLCGWTESFEDLPHGLQRVFSRARSVDLSGDWPLLDLLDLSDSPAAALCALHQQFEPTNRHWLRFDPVQLTPDLTAVWIRSRAELNLSAESMQPLLSELSAMFEAAGLNWRLSRCGHYGLIQSSEPFDCRFAALDQCIGHRLDEVLPQGRHQSLWRQLMNESQMIFHQFKSLADGRADGFGLWFWGAGKLVPAAPALTGSIVTAESEQQHSDHWLGLAKHAGLQITAGHGIQAGIGCQLVESAMIQSSDQLERLDQAWVQPALKALKTGRLGRLTLVDQCKAWLMRPAEYWAFWRRRRA